VLNNLIQIVKEYFYQIIIGFVMLLIGFGLGIIAKKISKKALEEIKFNRFIRIIGIDLDGETIISSILSYLIYFVTFIFFLRQLGITSIVLYILLGAVLMILILTFLVGIKDIIPNFIAWLSLKNKPELRVGKRVEVKEISGEIEKIGIFETEIKTERGDILYVPNSLFLKTKFWLRK
jgi:small-conductance mechanosensitive channel